MYNDLPATATAKRFLDSLLVSAFANAQVVDASGNQVTDDSVIDNSMKLKVTAEDGATVNNYILKVGSLPTFEANYRMVVAGEAWSKTILVNIKANQTGRVYMIAVPNGAAAPTSAQVKAGTDAAGKFVANANYDLSLGEEKVEKITVDADNTSYNIYVVLLSANGTLQLKPVKLTATSPIALSKPDNTVTLSELKYKVENIKKMSDIPVGDKVGYCSDQSAKDALNSALSAAQALIEKGSAAQEDINNALNKLHEAEKLFKSSIVPELMAGEYKSITASSDFNQMIKRTVSKLSD